MPFYDISNRGSKKVQSNDNKATKLERKSKPNGRKDFQQLLEAHLKKQQEHAAAKTSEQQTDEPTSEKLRVIESVDTRSNQETSAASVLPTESSSDFASLVAELMLLDWLFLDEMTYEDQVVRYFEKSKRRCDMWYCSLCSVCLPWSESGEMEETHCNGRKHRNASQNIIESVTQNGDTKCHCTLCNVDFYIESGNEFIVHCKGRKHRRASALADRTAATSETTKGEEFKAPKNKNTPKNKKIPKNKKKPHKNQPPSTAEKVRYGWVKDEISTLSLELDPGFFDHFQNKGIWDEEALLTALLEDPFFIRPIVAESPDEFFDSMSAVENSLMQNGLDFTDLSIAAQASNDELDNKWASYLKAIDEKDSWANDVLAERLDLVDFLDDDMELYRALKYAFEDKEGDTDFLPNSSIELNDIQGPDEQIQGPDEELKKKWKAYLERCDHEDSEWVQRLEIVGTATRIRTTLDSIRH